MPRHPLHDYKSVCTYHITIKKAPTAPIFSVISGSIQHIKLDYTPLGKVIKKNIYAIRELNRALQIYQYVIMPDHIHLLLRVNRYLDRHVGIYISKFKIKILQMAREKGIWNDSVFDRDYHDRFLLPEHSLNQVYEYIQQNPYRLMVRRFYPEHFRRVNNLFIYQNMQWQAYGNMNLLSNPFKSAVVCHRADAGTEKELTLRQNWLHIVGNGGVLISPFVARKEKGIRAEAEGNNGKVILITNKAFSERYKPAAHDFHQCELGNLLIIAPPIDLPDCKDTFTFLNKLADDIATGKVWI